MALTSTEEALVRQLLDQQAAILSLAGNESTITSKLGATKVTLSDLLAASAVGDTDLFLTRQGATDKSVTGAVLRNTLQTFLQDGAGAVVRAMNSKVKEIVSVKDFGAIGNGIADDYAAIQAAHDSLPADGGLLYFPRGVYSVGTKLRVTKRNVRFVGENKFNSYIAPTVAIADAPIHVMGFSFELSDMTVYSPAGVGGYCIWSRGAGDLYIHDNVLMNGGSNNTGYGIVLEDVNESLTFVPGAYRHRIERNFISTGGNYFSYGIVTGANCTGGGMNACVIAENHIITQNGISLAVGGGNLLRGNLLQSATGGNSGTRPYTGGSGYGCVFGGELHAVGNYFERFAYDFWPNSSGAVSLIAAHTSDASNEVYGVQAGYPSPVICETGYGLSAEKLDVQVSPVISANGTTLPTNRRAMKLAGNGSPYTGLLLSTVGAKDGQLLTLWNNSYAMHFSNGGAIDLNGFGSQLILGQQGLSLNGVQTHGNSATFIFTESGTWRLLHVSKHAPSIGGSLQYSFAGDNETLPTQDAYINITGNGAARTGALLASGKSYGQSLTITANSWAVTFAASAAVWSSAGAPTLGNSAGQCMSVQLVYTPSGWYEVSRSVR